MRDLVNKLSGKLTIFILIVLPLSLLADDLTITVTNANLGLIKEQRRIELKKGLQLFNLVDIPSGIRPSSVLVESDDHAFQVLEQNYEYDLIDVDKVLNKSIDRTISLEHPEYGTLQGVLRSASSGHLILTDTEGRLQIIPRNPDQKIIIKDFGEAGAVFITRPTLVWKINAKSAGRHRAQISYLTGGLNWQADYVGRLNEKDTEITLACWVTIENNSGRAFEEARLKLIAGDINVLRESRQPRMRKEQVLDYAVAEAFEEKAFFEYHLYTLQRTTDLKNNQIKQIQLFPETVSPVEKIYRLDSNRGNQVDVYVTLQNSKEQNLGFPLPGGTIRLYKSDGPDLEFIGEDRIRHTSRDEKMEIVVGKAFDVVSEREVSETQRPTKRSKRQQVEYTLRNHKEENVQIEILERMNTNHEVTLHSSSHKLAEKKAGYLKFIVPVKAGGKSTLTLDYTAQW